MGKIKFILLSLATAFVCVLSGKWFFLPFCVIELLLLFCLTSILYEHRPKISYFLNCLLTFIYVAQLFVLGFSGEFISMLMLENVNMLSNLGQELILYILTALPLAGILLLPTGRMEWLRANMRRGLYMLLIYLGVLLVASSILPASPYTATASLVCRSVQAGVAKKRIERMDKNEILKYFHRDSVRKGNIAIGLLEKAETPSVILILTEGLSAEVLDVYNDLGRSLTPNIDSLYSKSLVFDNYYNHTAATFRAVRGQLYSSHQSEGGYGNDGKGLGQIDDDIQKDMLETKLVSLVDVLKSYDTRYNVCYINPEPGDSKIVSYLYSLGMETVESGDYGHLYQRTDKQIYDVLKNKVREFRSKQEPYFLIFYNLGTHHGFDSPDLKYGDGTNEYLNKFYNYDAAFGNFFRDMKKEGVFEDTMLIFSADHATYPAPEYQKTFKSSQRTFISKIPLFFYFDGIRPDRYDAKGRNSLDLAPTILDILNYEDRENYFLGTSLFCDDEDEYSHLCAVGEEFFYVSEEGLIELDLNDFRVDLLRKYYEISLNY